jgi:succinate dehydrogenase / fumarate reductase cytochrome b subunit
MATTVIKEGQPGSHSLFRDSFLLHKLHSLSGVLPIGFFMVFHLLANSYSLRGETEFNTVVKVIGYLPFVFLVELAVIFVPILFHAIYGLFIVAEMQGPGGNVAYYGYGRNWLYWLQRWSGVVALVYITYHVFSTTGHRWMYEVTGGAAGHEEGFRAIAYEAMAWRFAGWGYTLFYVLGITAATFHLANGLFNFCIRWGITVGSNAQRISAYLWSVLGVALALIGVLTAVNFHFIGAHYRTADGQVVNLREQFNSLDDVVKSGDQAPAAPIPGAKPDTSPDQTGGTTL